jgi:transcriptional regulator with XRE-family HTH domain
MTGYHTRWVLPDADPSDPERIAIRQALAFGKAVYERRAALQMSIAKLALRAGMNSDEIECIEEGGTEPTIPVLRRLAAALDADVRITAGDDLGSVGCESHAA